MQQQDIFSPNTLNKAKSPLKNQWYSFKHHAIGLIMDSMNFCSDLVTPRIAVCRLTISCQTKLVEMDRKMFHVHLDQNVGLV